jgi:hypothetical protein
VAAVSETSVITREQIDTLRGLLQDVDNPTDRVAHRAVGEMYALLNRVEARGHDQFPALAAEVQRLQVEIDRLEGVLEGERRMTETILKDFKRMNGGL